MTKDQLKHLALLVLAAALAAVAGFFKDSAWSWAPLIVSVLTALVTRLDKLPPPSPGTAVVILAAAITGGSFGCWLTKPPPVVPSVPDGGFPDASPGTAFKDCSSDAVHSGELAILADVSTDLALGPALGVQALEALAASQAIKDGGALALAEVWCGVQWLLGEAQQQFDRTADSIESTKVATAKAYLAKHAWGGQ